MKLNILGQDYDLQLRSGKQEPKLDSYEASGLAELYSKRLIINKNNFDDDPDYQDNMGAYVDKVVRHEIIHAYFHEAGLGGYCHDEDLVDWIAIQLPKIIKTLEIFESKKDKFYNSK